MDCNSAGECRWSNELPRGMNMDVYEAIIARRTVRDFHDREIDLEIIERILDAGKLRTLPALFPFRVGGGHCPAPDPPRPKLPWHPRERRGYSKPRAGFLPHDKPCTIPERCPAPSSRQRGRPFPRNRGTRCRPPSRSAYWRAPAAISKCRPRDTHGTPPLRPAWTRLAGD